MSLQNTRLTSNIGTIYTSSGSSAISAMYFCNSSGSAATFNLYAVPSGGSAGGSTIIYSTIQIAANDTYVADWEKIVLGNGDTLQANASANTSITATVSYIGI